jgi:hypothetical protein
MNNQLNNKKDWLIKGKITKSYITFSENKPNVKDAKMNVTNLITMNYTIFTSLTVVKNKPNQTQLKPKQSQFKPNCFKGQNERKRLFTKGLRKYFPLVEYKNKPKQTQFL